MTYINLRVRPVRAIHGYDEHNKAITEEFKDAPVVEKVIALDRILSFTADEVFISVPHGRVQVWAYEESLDSVKSQLANAGLLLK
jgi:hypothetical protein